MPRRVARRGWRRGQGTGRTRRPSNAPRSGGSDRRYRLRRLRRARRRSGHEGRHRHRNGPAAACRAGRDAAQHDVVAVIECVDVEAGAVANLGTAVLSSSSFSAMSKSSRVVSLMLRSEPGTSTTFGPRHSAIAASSVKLPGAWPRAARCAARMSRKPKPCGVCARHSPRRSTVRRTWPASSSFSVSATGSAARHAGASSERGENAVDDIGVSSGRAASWIRERAADRGRQTPRARKNGVLHTFASV